MFNKMSCKATCILLIILWFTYITYGCFCVTKHPQSIFCEENVVVFVGKVTKEELPKTTQNRYIRYYFKLVTSLKGIRESVGSTIIAQTPSGTSCDMRLTVGEKILLSGTK
ncbi:metalloproteinase inhibitor 1-like [Mytilus trossulus]|uniref:metalloproteinase inhibitor 1-like n=1 Tax=Mytilus trossulus TaxID=6551 RepID=UPI003005548F